MLKRYGNAVHAERWDQNANGRRQISPDDAEGVDPMQIPQENPG